jgi:hypothetical protein
MYKEGLVGMEKAKNINQSKAKMMLGLVAVTCVCIAVFVSFGQITESVTQAQSVNPKQGTPPPCPDGIYCDEGYVWDTRSCTCVTPTSFPYGSKGIGDGWQNWATPTPSGPVPGTNLDVLDFDWYYDWRVDYVPGRGSDPRYVRMVYCDDTSGIVAAASDDYNNGRRGRVWLVYNEPDHSNFGTCGYKFVGDPPERMYQNHEWAASHFSDVYDLVKGADPSALVFVGGLVFLDSQRTRDWWQDFINTLQAEENLHKIDGVHVHVYPLVSHSTNPPTVDTSCNNATDNYCVPDTAQAANDWYDEMHVGLGLGDRPIWITEMGWLYCVGQQNDRSWVRSNFMEPISQWFAEDTVWPYDPQVSLNPGYESVAWYSTYDSGSYKCSNLLDSRGTSGAPTELGQSWNGYQP